MLHNIDDYEGSWALRIEDLKLISAQRGYTANWRNWYKTETVDDSLQRLDRSSGLHRFQQLKLCQDRWPAIPRHELG